jgi:hypothetical protein
MTGWRPGNDMTKAELEERVKVMNRISEDEAYRIKLRNDRSLITMRTEGDCFALVLLVLILLCKGVRWLFDNY